MIIHIFYKWNNDVVDIDLIKTIENKDVTHI
jgi:hypothetical protein